MRAVITGANRGIGLELAHQLIARGAEVHGGVHAGELLDWKGNRYPW